MNRALISFTLLLMGVFNGHAQKIPDYSLKHNMKQDGLSMEFTVLDTDKKQPSHHHSNKTYFWYKAQKVIQTQGGHAGIPLHGLFRSFYSNKQLCDQGEFNKGLKSGTWTYWNPTGTLNRQEHWKNGEQRGKQYYYNEKGKLQKIVAICRYKGKQHPDSLEWIRGRHIKITVYDSLGNKTASERYYNGLQDGKSVYYSDTSSYSVTYDNGIVRTKQAKKTEKTDKKTEASESKKEQTPFFQRLQFWKKKDPAESPEEKSDGKKAIKNPPKEKKSGNKPKEESRPKKEKKNKTPAQ